MEERVEHKEVKLRYERGTERDEIRSIDGMVAGPVFLYDKNAKGLKFTATQQ